MTAEYQAHSGAVNTAKTPVVNYGYSDPGTGKSRLTSMTYPDRSVLAYTYNSGLDDSISRLSSISFNTVTAESYTYLGISTVVQRSNPMVTLSYINGSNVTGLDSFGRVTDQKWTDTRTSTVTDDFGYTYDADSNRTKETNALYADFNTTYTYDSFNQLSSSTRADGKDSESWSSDPLGNSTTVSGQSRGYNAQNEVTSVGGSSLAYDLNGNVITDEAGRKLTYDAWNRLVQVAATNCSCCCCNTTTVVAAYSYDALGRRIKETHGSTTTDLYYSNQWQVLEEVQGGAVTADNVWSPVYVDALVLVKQIPSCGPTQMLYVQQDANWNVTAVVNSAGVQQRFVYTPFGVQTVLQANFTSSSSSAMIAYASQGLRLDSVIGDYENRGRVKDPVLQRFLQGDPAKADISTYRVEGNTPLSEVDPNGLDDVKFEADFKDPRAKMQNDSKYTGKKLDGKTSSGDAIHFTFLKAQKGEYPFLGAGGNMVRGVYVKIQVDVDSARYDEVQLLQLVRTTIYYVGNPEAIPTDPEDPVRRQRAGWGEKDVPSPGWRVDAPISSTNPFFGKKGYSVETGAKRSTLWDAPGDWVEYQSRGKQFITIAVGLKAGKDPAYLGSVRWGYYTDKTGNVAFDPKGWPTIDATVPAELGHGLFRWNKIQGNEKIEKMTGVNIAYPPAR